MMKFKDSKVKEIRFLKRNVTLGCKLILQQLIRNEHGEDIWTNVPVIDEKTDEELSPGSWITYLP